MNRHLMGIFLLAGALGAWPATGSTSFDLDVLVDGAGRPEYSARGTTYVEAVRGRAYSLRITNPTPYRVAVALSVDGLNTIDARHTDAWSASKWVLDPWESTVIDGWQVDSSTARRFVFTGERHSYGAALGQTGNLGVIEAVFYRERRREVRAPAPWEPERSDAESNAGTAPQAPSASAAPRAEAQQKGALSDDYAATGMGGRTANDVWTVAMNLDPQPLASIRIRYEFRPQLVRLGVLPAHPTPLERRERARGFGAYCPEVDER